MSDSNVLPDKPSALIRLALDDLEKVEKDGRYRVDMTQWHGGWRPERDIPCRVCLAGAVMAKTLGTNLRASIVPRDSHDGYKLRSLNDFREGRIEDGLHWFYALSGDCPVELAQGQAYRTLARYDHDAPGKFHADMTRLADFLEGLGA